MIAFNRRVRNHRLQYSVEQLHSVCLMQAGFPLVITTSYERCYVDEQGIIKLNWRAANGRHIGPFVKMKQVKAVVDWFYSRQIPIYDPAPGLDTLTDRVDSHDLAWLISRCAGRRVSNGAAILGAYHAGIPLISCRREIPEADLNLRIGMCYGSFEEIVEDLKSRRSPISCLSRIVARYGTA